MRVSEPLLQPLERLYQTSMFDTIETRNYRPPPSQLRLKERYHRRLGSSL
jgi:hypothetical protein